MTNIIGQNSPTLSREVNLNVLELEKNAQKNPFPKDSKVSIIVGENESPRSIHRRFLMQATSEAGLDKTTQQDKFVERFLRNGIKFADPKDDPSEKNDTNVREGELSKGSNSYLLGADEVKYLKQLQQEFIAEGGKLRRGKDYSLPKSLDQTKSSKKDFDDSGIVKVNLHELAKQAEVLNLTSIGIPTDPNELKSFFLNLSNESKMSLEDNALFTLIKQNFGGGNLENTHFREILSLAKDAGVTVQNLKVTGNLARFDLTVTDILKLKIARISVQEKANRVEKVYRDAMDNNEISAFIRGVVKGGYKSVAGTVELLVNFPETVKMLLQVVGSPVETFNALYKELGETWDEFKQADSSKKAEMIGELVGEVVVGILLGKGIGKLGSILKATKTGNALIEKAKVLKAATATKLAEKFSDEAAKLASQRARQKLATQVYAGIPADVLLDMAIVAGNKLKNGAVKFADFSKHMVDEFGEKVKPKLLELYQDSFEKVFGKRKTLTLDELLGGHTIKRHVGKSDNWLQKRLSDDASIPSASTFTNEAIANRTIVRFVKENQEMIENWLKSGKHRLESNFEMDESVGRILTRGKGNAPNSKPFETQRVRISLVRDNTPQGWHVNTSFPITPKGKFNW